ncbi:UNVERIFIED_CONTAM: hypothetical protein Slati_0920800 [Sesamum latifolium]|uniref:Retrovirus-related Pol polyprotein from transposon RE1 n=1 Tax=Sesamum latifolium TaxID=2727402 RepID=A0AAW2XU21_9LAMI
MLVFFKPRLQPLLCPYGSNSELIAGSKIPNPESYRRLIGKLMYLGFSRPDISHASPQLSQILQHPSKQHSDIAVHLRRYLKGTTDKGLLFPVGDSTIFVDTTCELTWVHNFIFRRLKHLLQYPSFVTNQAAIHIMANSVFHERTKHLKLDFHLVRVKYKARFVAPKHISSMLQLADVFTKTLTRLIFLKMISKLD